MAEDTLWRVALCDLLGNELQLISTLARQKKFGFRLKRAQPFAFTVDSADPRVGGTAYDGYPYLSRMRRRVKAWRLEQGRYVLRYSGTVWQVSTEAEDHPSTSVVCFDAMKQLEKRRLLSFKGSDALVLFGGTTRQNPGNDVDRLLVDGAQIAKALVDRTNTVEGPTGISTATELGAVFEDVPNIVSARFERSKLAPGLLQLADAFNGFDFDLVPVDRVDGTMAVLSCYALQGVDRDEVKLAWGLPPHSVRKMTQLGDGDTVANDLFGYSGVQGFAALVGHETHQPSVDAIGRYVDNTTYTTIVFQQLLDDLLRDELGFRAYGKETVTSLPAIGGPFPWDDFDKGDRVQVLAHRDFLGGFAGVQRIWGYDVAVDDDSATESCEAVYTSETS